MLPELPPPRPSNLIETWTGFIINREINGDKINRAQALYLRAIRARRMPRQPNNQWTVMAIIGRPRRMGRRERYVYFTPQCIEI